MIELSLRKNNEEVMRYQLSKEQTTVGRASSNDLCLPDPSISRVHLTILRRGDKYIATDRSTNGTFLNNERISTCELNPNDVLRLGEWTIHFAAGKTAPDAATKVEDRDPTRVLSYRPEKDELVLERAIVYISDGGNDRQYSITKPILSIGKSASNDIVLTDDFVSNFHCRIENRNGTYFIKDLGSTNGTLLNNRKVVEAEMDMGSTITIGRATIRVTSSEERRKLGVISDTEFEGMISVDPKMHKVFALIDRVAPSDTTVLINGETGAGKELVARALHHRSTNAKGPFVAINCGAISKDLIESELFGHEKGAFTSAHQQRKGAFEQAHGGTLFLDEIGELPLDLQPKLLRVLETREIKRVGGHQAIPVQVRVVAATHRDLAREVKKGRFREDLFFRLYVVPIQLTPLRERPKDIPLLAERFLRQEFSGPGKGPAKTLDSSAIEKLVDYAWPGNVRELKNVISRAVLNCQTSTIGEPDIQFTPLGSMDRTEHQYDEDTKNIPRTVTRTLEDVEKERIVMELRRHNWNKTETAKSLGIAKSTLHEKIKKYSLKPEA